MPRNPAGTAYTPPNQFTSQSGQTISSAQMDANFQDVGGELVNSLPADGRRAMSGPLRLASGVANLPGLSFASDPDTGFFWAASGEFGIASNGNEIARITPAGLTLDNPESLAAISDELNTHRPLDGTWLRRDGSLYNKSQYPDLADLLPTLPDGAIWENIAGTSGNSISALTQGSGRLVASSQLGSDAKIIASINGAPWELRATIPNFTPNDMAFGGGVYCAVDSSGKFSQSSDGDNWAAPIVMPGVTSPNLFGVAYGLGLFVAAGRDSNGRAVWTSPDGATWTKRTVSAGSAGANGQFNGVDFINNVFVATGGAGGIVSSTDGITWTERTSGVTQSLFAATYVSGVYVVVGGAGVILTSSNLSGWTPRSSGTTAELYAVVGNSLGLLVTGATGTARISDTAGVNWTAAATGSTASLLKAIIDSGNPARYIVAAGANFIYGLRTQSSQFRVPNDNPNTGWIKALNELP